MHDKFQLNQLKTKTKNELLEIRQQMEKSKIELEALKAKGGGAFTDEQQDELNELVLAMVDLDELIEAQPDTKANVYKVPAKESSLIHIELIKGRRFNPNTGKEESFPYVQKLTYGEWQLFKQNFSRLGYVIIKVLHDPYNEVANFIKA